MVDPRTAQVRLAIYRSDLKRGPLAPEQQAELLELAESLRLGLEEAGGWRVLGDRLVESLARSAQQAEQAEPYLRSLATSRERWTQAALRASDWRVLVVLALIAGALLGALTIEPVSIPAALGGGVAIPPMVAP